MNNSDMTVLLVDDDEMIRECMTAYLEDEGFRVHGASSGEEGLTFITIIKPDVCITDMRLPGMHGDEFIIKAFDLHPTTRFFLHTGMLYTLSDELRSIGMVHDDVLQKPMHNLALLVHKIKRMAIPGRTV